MSAAHQIEKPLQCLLTFSYSVGVRNILQTALLSIFCSFYFLNALQSDNNSNIVMFLGINIFWALLRAHFNPRLTTRAKMSRSRAQNIFMPANINSIVLLYMTVIIMMMMMAILLILIVVVKRITTTVTKMIQ